MQLTRYMTITPTPTPPTPTPRTRYSAQGSSHALTLSPADVIEFDFKGSGSVVLFGIEFTREQVTA